MGHVEPVEILCPLLSRLPFEVLKSNLNETSAIACWKTKKLLKGLAKINQTDARSVFTSQLNVIEKLLYDPRFQIFGHCEI